MGSCLTEFICDRIERISGVGCGSDGKERVWDDLLACDWLQHPHPSHLTTPSKVVYVQVGNRELTNKVRKEDQG